MIIVAHKQHTKLPNTYILEMASTVNMHAESGTIVTVRDYYTREILGQWTSYRQDENDKRPPENVVMYDNKRMPAIVAYFTK